MKLIYAFVEERWQFLKFRNSLFFLLRPPVQLNQLIVNKTERNV